MEKTELYKKWILAKRAEEKSRIARIEIEKEIEKIVKELS